MIRQLNVRAVLTALTTTLALAACSPRTASHNEVPTPVITVTEVPTVVSTTRPAIPPSTATPSPTPRPTESAGVPVVDNLWEWRVTKGPSDDILPPSDFDGEILVWEELGDQIEGERWTVRLMVQTRGETWEFYQSALGWGPNDVQVAEGRIVLVEYENEHGDYNLWVYDVQTREPTFLEEWAGEPYRHLVPWLSLDGDRLAWNTTLADGRSCIRICDLETGAQFDAICSADDLTVLDRHYLRWPVLTYQEERARDSEWSSSDRTIYTLRLPDGEPRPHEVGRGVGFQGAADESVLIWTEMSSGYYNPWSVPIYGEGPDGQVVRLGRGAAGSEAVCGGRAYWEVDLGGRPDEVRSWMPGGPVEVIYRSPEVARVSSYATGKPQCHGDLVMIQRAGGLNNAPGSPDEILIATIPTARTQP